MYIFEKLRAQLLIKDAKQKNYYQAINEYEWDQATVFKIAKSLLHPKCTATLLKHYCVYEFVADFNLFFINKIVHTRDNLDFRSNIIYPNVRSCIWHCLSCYIIDCSEVICRHWRKSSPMVSILSYKPRSECLNTI